MNESRVLGGVIVGASLSLIREVFEQLQFTVGVFEFSEEELIFSERLENCTGDPISISFELISETGGAQCKFILASESRDEFKIPSISEKKLLETGFFGSIQHTVYSEVFEWEVSIVKCGKNFKMISVLINYSSDCSNIITFTF